MIKGIKTRGAILDQAIYIASTIGFDALTIGKLSTSVGMSKSGLFAHFNSKEQLQLDLLKATAKKFSDLVIKPSKKKPKGEMQIRAIAENLMNWDNADFMPGGCLLMTASIEFDDRPGPVHDYLVRHQRFWFNYLSRIVNYAISTGHFRNELDSKQFTFEFQSIFPSYHNASRFLKDPQAEERAWTMLDKMLDNARS